jgi:phosphoribosyl-AMP cyclohydrolase
LIGGVRERQAIRRLPTGRYSRLTVGGTLSHQVLRDSGKFRAGLNRTETPASGHFPLFIRAIFVLSCSTMSFYDQLKFDANGLIPTIIQEHKTGRVMMFAWMNRASLEKTIATGKTHFWSRSRQKFWMKGEESGHTQTVKDIAFDCDGDVLLIQVEQIGAACHEGYQSCFFRSIEGQGESFKVTEPQLQKPEEIYKKKK